ncbi:hypothetical protein TorRG33x02_250180 [Trema orientale]|uniref:Uncharacterized protein n=1 Tax=Trema orientale TaxID=63057 RepID=A0A2P5DIZ8_TREOI|nr:hypothetical protein TorRG33x02_250180 [Trema orientale]
MSFSATKFAKPIPLNVSTPRSNDSHLCLRPVLFLDLRTSSASIPSPITLSRTIDPHRRRLRHRQGEIAPGFNQSARMDGVAPGTNGSNKLTRLGSELPRIEGLGPKCQRR